MKTLVIGGDGLLGSYWMRAHKTLHPHDPIVGTTRRKNSQSNHIFLDLSESNLINFDHFLKEIAAGTVIYLAGITNVEECEKDKDLALNMNAHYPHLISAACHRLAVRFLYISTDHMFNGSGRFFSETEPASPVNHYAFTKKVAEDLILKDNPTSLIVRTNFYGKSISDKPSFTDWIESNLRAQKEMKIAEDIFFNPVFMGDLVQISDQLLRLNQTGIFNVTSDERVSKFEFATQFADFFKLDSRFIQAYREKDFPRKVKRPLEMSLSNEKVKQITKYPVGNLSNGFERLKKEIEGPAL